jgi:hypothetical protein
VVVSEALFLIGVYKTLKSTHELVKDLNETVLRNAKIKGILEIRPDDVRHVEEQLRVLERVQDEVGAEHRWRTRQREAIAKRRDAATGSADRARRQTDLDILDRKIKALEGTAAALNQKEKTLHNIDAILKKAETLGSKKAARLRKAGEISTKELDEVGIDVAALSSKLDEEHKASESVLRWLEKESRAGA